MQDDGLDDARGVGPGALGDVTLIQSPTEDGRGGSLAELGLEHGREGDLPTFTLRRVDDGTGR